MLQLSLPVFITVACLQVLEHLLGLMIRVRRTFCVFKSDTLLSPGFALLSTNLQSWVQSNQSAAAKATAAAAEAAEDSDKASGIGFCHMSCTSPCMSCVTACVCMEVTCSYGTSGRGNDAVSTHHALIQAALKPYTMS